MTPTATSSANDSQQRLSGITLPDGSQVAYRYDAFVRRIAKEVDATITHFIWQCERLIAESAAQVELATACGKPVWPII